MSNDGGQDDRDDPRSNVFLTANLQAGERSYFVRVRNISARGAMVDGTNLPPEGAAVRLNRGSLTATAEVVWQTSESRGIRFDQEIDVAEWVKRVGHPGQQLVDRTVQALRSGQSPPSAMKTLYRRSARDLGEELRQICEQLAMTPDLSIEVGEALIRIEAIAVELTRSARDH